MGEEKCTPEKMRKPWLRVWEKGSRLMLVWAPGWLIRPCGWCHWGGPPPSVPDSCRQSPEPYRRWSTESLGVTTFTPEATLLSSILGVLWLLSRVRRWLENCVLSNDNYIRTCCRADVLPEHKVSTRRTLSRGFCTPVIQVHLFGWFYGQTLRTWWVVALFVTVLLTYVNVEPILQSGKVR